MVSHLSGASPHGLVFWQHGGLRSITLLIIRGIWLPGENESCWSSWRLHSKWALCHFGYLLLWKAVTGPAQMHDCGVMDSVSWRGSDKTTFQKSFGMGDIITATFGKCNVSHLESQAWRAVGLLSIHILGCVFKSIMPLGMVFLSCLCLYPPQFFSRKIYWVPTKG